MTEQLTLALSQVTDEGSSADLRVLSLYNSLSSAFYYANFSCLAISKFSTPFLLGSPLNIS